jgi:aminopeptidase N
MHRYSTLLRALALGALLADTLAAAGIPGANLTRAEAAARAARVSDVAYTLKLDLEDAATSDVYHGEVAIEFQLRAGAGEDLDLDFQAAVPTGAPVRSLVVNGEKVEAPAYANARLTLPGALLKSGGNRVEVAYSTTYDNDGAGLHKAKDPADGNVYLYTHFEPYDANRLFPCFDQPDLKATYELTVDAPKLWHVVSGGALDGIDPGNVQHFARTKRYSTYIFALCAGPFRVWTDNEARIPSRVLVTRSMAQYADPEDIFEVTRQGFDFFEEYFEVPYPFGKYDQIFVPQFNWGAMENVGCVIFNDRMIYRQKPTQAQLERRANTILHEMAHMWFGDIVTMKWWNDLWLNESFATYMAHLGLVRATRFTDGWKSFARGTKGWAYWQDQLPTTHPIETPVPDTKTTFENFDGITYGKGASTLKQLAFYVGEEAFRQGVAAYLKEHSWGNATRRDFVDSIAVAADLDLSGWTRKWLQASGVNTITPELTVQGGVVRRFELVQEEGNGAAILRPHRLKVAFYEQERPGAAPRTSKVVTVRVDGRRTRVPELEGIPAPSFVHANHDDHAFAKIFLDPASLAMAKQDLDAFEDSALRSAVWQTVWFMVRDGAAPPSDLVDLFLAKGPSEPDAKVLGSIARNVGTAISHYLTEPERTRYRRRVRGLAWTQAKAAAPGSDLQRAWVKLGVETTWRPTEALRLVRLLRGDDELPGFPVDQPTRWSFVKQICAVGAPGARSLLEAEERRDKSQKGRDEAFQAYASLPEAGVKAEVWKKFTEDAEAELSLQLVAAPGRDAGGLRRPVLRRPADHRPGPGRVLRRRLRRESLPVLRPPALDPGGRGPLPGRGRRRPGDPAPADPRGVRRPASGPLHP